MSKKVKQWAIRARRALLAELGAKCAWCGSTEDLTFDCIVPTGDDHHKGSTDQRMIFYRKQHQQDNVQVLCHTCNGKKGEAIIDFRPVPELNWSHLGNFPIPPRFEICLKNCFPKFRIA